MLHEIRSLLPYVPVLFAIRTPRPVALLMISQTRVKESESIKFILINLSKFHVNFNTEKSVMSMPSFPVDVSYTHPKATMYTAYDVARQILQMREYAQFDTCSFAELPKDILTAMLWIRSEWRDSDEIEELIQMGADPHETHDNFSVLDNFIQGHDGYWRGKDLVKEVEDGVKMLTKYGVTREDLSHSWILSNCEEIIKNSAYLSTFFGVEPPDRVKFYFHAPRAEKLTESKMTFKDVEDAVKTLHCMTDLDQYVAVLEYHGDVSRYLVTKGCGHLSVIPMESKEQERIANIVNFVSGTDKLPMIVCDEV